MMYGLKFAPVDCNRDSNTIGGRRVFAQFDLKQLLPCHPSVILFGIDVTSRPHWDLP